MEDVSQRGPRLSEVLSRGRTKFTIKGATIFIGGKSVPKFKVLRVGKLEAGKLAVKLGGSYENFGVNIDPRKEWIWNNRLKNRTLE